MGLHYRSRSMSLTRHLNEIIDMVQLNVSGRPARGLSRLGAINEGRQDHRTTPRLRGSASKRRGGGNDGDYDFSLHGCLTGIILRIRAH